MIMGTVRRGVEGAGKFKTKEESLGSPTPRFYVPHQYVSISKLLAQFLSSFLLRRNRDLIQSPQSLLPLQLPASL